MSHTLTPVPQYDAAAITIPDNGDANTIDSIEAAFQKLADRAQHAVNGVASRMQWAETTTVDANGSNSSFAVHVGGIQMIALARVDGTYRLASAVAATLTAAHLESGATLGNSEWRYIYAYDPGDGSVAFQLSTTAPTASLTFKSGAGGFVYRYLGCFRTDTSGAPLPQSTVGRFTVYSQPYVGGADAAAGTGPTSGFAALSLATRVPPHARVALCDIVLTGDAVWRAVTYSGDTGNSNQAANNHPIALPDGGVTMSWRSLVTGSITVNVRGYHA